MTTEERLEKLEQELARANRRNRWLMAVVVLAVVGAWIGLDMYADHSRRPSPGSRHLPKVIRANEFILEDVDGKTRAGLACGQGRASADPVR